jgi:DNA topoisomerase-1
MADTIITDLRAPFTVTAVEKKEVKRSPPPPYTTSALQIDVGRKLGFTAKRTMQTAQKLYEEGLITYHRTDSVNLSTKFLAAAAEYIKATYGEAYSHYRTYATKSKLAQEAHEAIRPTDVAIKPPAIYEKNGSLQTDHERLYDLIWKRALASQAKEAIFDATTIKITSTNLYIFTTQGSVIIFDGYLKITGYETEAQILPPVTVGEVVQLTATNPQQKFTAPPPRYSEASLIKALEEAEIGRPSTYAPTLSTIQDRQYVEKETKDGRRGRNFIPTELGLLVSDFLVKYFPKIVDLPFTATMEEGFDEIAQGAREWVPVISEFYGPFKQQLQQVEATVEKLVPPQEKTGEMCPECKQGELIIKEGRFGKFVACTRFPECKYTKNLVEKIGMKCPTCKIGEVVVKKTKTGKTFYGCSRYPECTFAAWKNPILPATPSQK